MPILLSFRPAIFPSPHHYKNEEEVQFFFSIIDMSVSSRSMEVDQNWVRKAPALKMLKKGGFGTQY